MFGQRAAEAMLEEGLRAEPLMAQEQIAPQSGNLRQRSQTLAQVAALREKLRDLMWQICGIVARPGRTIDNPKRNCRLCAVELPPATTRENAELRNMHTVAELIVASALARKESRGAHARTDFPQHDPGPAKHSRMVHGHVDFVAFD